MKKAVSILVVALVILSVSAGAFATTYYYEPETGVSFVVPDGWTQKEFNKSKDVLKCKFKYLETENLIMYGFSWSNSRLINSTSSPTLRSRYTDSVISFSKMR